MAEKLDPNLQAMVESPTPLQPDETVQVIVGLARPASQHQLEALRNSGLQVRSVIGDVLTGSAKIGKIRSIAENELVTTIEASAPLYPE
jgi:hypothetical protein